MQTSIVRTLAAIVLAGLAASDLRAQGIVEFVQPGCAPCRRMAPIVERFERAGVRFVRYDATSTDPVCRTLGVLTTPTFIAVDREGREVERIVGQTSESNLRRLAKRAGAIR